MRAKHITIDKDNFKFLIKDNSHNSCSIFDIPIDLLRKYKAQIAAVLWRKYLRFDYTEEDRIINGENFIPIKDIKFKFIVNGNLTDVWDIDRWDLEWIYNRIAKQP